MPGIQGLLVLFILSFVAGMPTPGCGVSDSVQKWMERVQTSSIPEEEELPSPQPLRDDEDDDDDRPFVVEDPDSPSFKYTSTANDPKVRVKRAPMENPSRQKSCSLYIQTDPLFWKHIWEQVRRETSSCQNHK